jgi:hypothetical protein
MLFERIELLAVSRPQTSLLTTHIEADSAREEDGILRDDCEAFPKLVNCYSRYIDAIQHDFARFELDKSKEAVRQC